MANATCCFTDPKQATNYDNNSKLQYEWAKLLLERNKNILENSKEILDVGCGNGRVTYDLIRPLVNPEANIVGCDISPAMIEVANTKYRDPKITFTTLDAEKIGDIYDNVYDCVFSSCCLQWLQDQTLALQNIHKSLQPNGSLILVVPAQSKNSVFPLGQKLSYTGKWTFFFSNCPPVSRSYYSVSEYGQLLNKTGFFVAGITTYHSSVTFTRDELREWIKPISHWYNYLLIHNADKANEFLEDLCDELLKDSSDIEFSRIEVVARKQS